MFTSNEIVSIINSATDAIDHVRYNLTDEQRAKVIAYGKTLPGSTTLNGALVSLLAKSSGMSEREVVRLTRASIVSQGKAYDWYTVGA